MSFFVENEDQIIERTNWRYVESGSPWRREGPALYVIQRRGEGDIAEGRFRIQDVTYDNAHRFRGSEILKWFIPFDNNLRPDAVAFTEQLTRAVLGGISIDEIQELLVRLEV